MFFIASVAVVVVFAAIITVLLLKDQNKKDSEKLPAESGQMRVLKKEVEALRIHLNETESRYHEAKNKLQQSQDEAAALLEKMKAAQHVRTLLEQEMGDTQKYKDDLAKLRIANESLQKEKQLAQEEIGALGKKVKQLDTTVCKEKETRAVLEQKLQTVKVQLAKAGEQERLLENLKAEESMYAHKVKELEDKIADLTRQNQAQQKLFSQLQKDNQQLSEQLNARTVSQEKDTTKEYKRQESSLTQAIKKALSAEGDAKENPQTDEPPASKEDETVPLESDTPARYSKDKKKKIGEILLENSVISRDVLKEALHYQKKFGVGIAQCLIAFGKISEQDLAQSISYQYSTPYMPLSACNITDEIIKLIPYEIASKYCLIPIDKTTHTIIVVMADPLDAEAISVIAKTTGYQVMAFVGILSDLTSAIEHYYKKDREAAQDESGERKIFIQTQEYAGAERRTSIRLCAHIPIRYVCNDQDVESKTNDISEGGFSFDSTHQFTLGDSITVTLFLPEGVFAHSVIEVKARVARVKQLEDQRFFIGAQFTDINQEQLESLIAYARSLITE